MGGLDPIPFFEVDMAPFDVLPALPVPPAALLLLTAVVFMSSININILFFMVHLARENPYSSSNLISTSLSLTGIGYASSVTKSEKSNYYIGTYVKVKQPY